MENVKTREPQQKRSIEKKNRIIEVGFRLMCENGYQKTTTADIAKAAGVSTGIIYSYFTDKRDIFIRGLEQYGEQIILPVYEQLTPGLDVMSSLNRIIDSIMDSHRIFQNAHKELEALTMTDNTIATIMFTTELKISKQLELLLANAGFDTENLAEKTHIIYNMVESLCHELTFHKHDDLDPLKMRQIVTDTIIFLLGEPHR